MDGHIIAFIGALRAAGVRVSTAEALDALRAVTVAGVSERAVLRDALRATLVKDSSDRSAFERLFAAYFAGDGAALVQVGGDDSPLTAEDLARLGVALGTIQSRLAGAPLADLLQAMVTGVSLGRADLSALLARTTPVGTGSPVFQGWMTRRALRELEFERLEGLLGELLDALRAAGVGAEALDEIERGARANREAVAAQVGGAVASQMARHEPPRRARADADELLDVPLRLLGGKDEADLRQAVDRLARRLRTRASLRRRKARRGPLDPRGTVRASLPYGGVPFTLRRRSRQIRPRLVVLCDISRSMRALAGFTLSLVYALHDQLSGTRAFAYIDDLHNISADFAAARPETAVARVLARISADYARTDLGSCLDDFAAGHMALVDRRTTVLILGDGRNNHSDPGLASLDQIRARARHLLWLTPEPRSSWGSGDSDMPAYARRCSAVHVVGSLRQLGEAIDTLFD